MSTEWRKEKATLGGATLSHEVLWLAGHVDLIEGTRAVQDFDWKTLE
jgi:hypothetical protein